MDALDAPDQKDEKCDDQKKQEKAEDDQIDPVIPFICCRSGAGRFTRQRRQLSKEPWRRAKTEKPKNAEKLLHGTFDKTL